MLEPKIFALSGATYAACSSHRIPAGVGTGLLKTFSLLTVCEISRERRPKR